MIDPRSEIRKGLLWLGSATALTRLFDLGTTLIIFMLLDEAQIGLAAMVWGFTIFLEAFAGAGVGEAIVQAPSVSPKELDSLHWFSLIVGFVLMGGTVLLSPFAAGFMGEPRLACLLMAWSPKLLVLGGVLVPLNLLRRNMMFRHIGAAETFSTLLSNAVKLILAWLGLGAWALVIGQASHAVFMLISVRLLSRFRARFQFEPMTVGRFVSFGLRSAAATILYHFYRKVDYLFVGKYLGTSALGVYAVACEFAMTPVDVLSRLINRITFPVLSRVGGDPPALISAFYRSLRYLLLLAGPVTVFLFFSSSDLLATVTHDRWMAASPVLRILCWAALLRAFARVFFPLFHASGQPELSIADSVWSLFVVCGCFFAALELEQPTAGLQAVGRAWLVAYAFIFAFLFLLARWRTAFSLTRLVRELLPVLITLSVMALGMAAVQFLMPVDAAPVARLLAFVVTGCALYALSGGVIFRFQLREILFGNHEK